MKLSLKIFKIAVAVLITAVLILFGAARLMQDRVADLVLTSLNNSISTKVHVGGFRFSFLSRFPRASLELNSVWVHSSGLFDASSFTGMNTDTLLSVRSVSIEFRITDVIRSRYIADRIRAKTGKLNILTDPGGRINYDITAGKTGKTGGELFIDLEKILAADIKTYYNNLSSRVIIEGVLQKGTLKSRIRNDRLTFTATGDLTIDLLKIHNFTGDKKIVSTAEVDLQKTKDGIQIRKGSIQFGRYDLGVEGFISSRDVYDLGFTGKDIDISRIREYLPERYTELFDDFIPSGILTIDGKIKGPMTKKINPHAEIGFRLEKGRLERKNTGSSADNISFSGIYSNGTGNCPGTGSLKINDITARIGNSSFSGSVVMSAFTGRPHTEIGIKGHILPEDIGGFFGLSAISTARGYVDADMRFTGDPDLTGKIKPADFLSLRPEGQLGFTSFDLGLKHDSLLVNEVGGTLLFGDNIEAKNLHFLYKKQHFSVNGQFRNLISWLTGKNVLLEAKADVALDRLRPEAFAAAPVQGPSKTKRKVFRLPGDLNLDINFRIDTLTYKTFSSSRISGSLNYKPKLLTFKSFTIKALKGSISGNGYILQNHNLSVLSRGIFNVSGVDVNQAFTSFQNFGQDFLKAENIAGSLSGTFSILLPLDSLLNPQIKSLTAEGKATLIDGGLINFDPVKELSAFIELSELRNIHFEKMENDFFIRNNYLYLPTMEVRSSAVDLSVNGKHSLDNDYEYHVKVLLSEILSKKRKKNKGPVTEFGEVKDDGLGRTSMLLKIVYVNGGEVKVSYDMKAAAVEVKSNMKSEQKKLKKILREEYGWYSKDSTLNASPPEKKSKFRIQWDDK